MGTEIIAILVEAALVLIYCARSFLYLFLFHFDLWTIEKHIKYTKLIINYKQAGSFRSNFSYKTYIEL